jgi:hypothetical protein
VLANSSAGGVASFNGRSGAVTLNTNDVTGAGGAPLAGPVFTGVPLAPTPAVGTATNQLATCAFVMAQIPAGAVTSFNGRGGAVTLTTADVTAAGGAPIASPAFTGTPSAPTVASTDNSTTLATTAFVKSAISAGAVASFNARTGAVTFQASDVSAVGGALLAGPAFTGAPTAPTASIGTSTTQLATTQFVAQALAGVGGVTSFNTRSGAVTLTLADVTGAGGAPLNAPTFTGIPAAPTAALGTSTTQIASTAFVQAAVTGGGAPVSPTTQVLTSGSGTYTTPVGATYIEVFMVGGGGGGGGSGGNGVAGGNSSFGSLTANGGGAGGSTTGGGGGSASGGRVNVQGGAGGTPTASITGSIAGAGGAGGNSYFGGGGTGIYNGSGNAAAPNTGGGGGGGGSQASVTTWSGGGGGSGGFCYSLIAAPAATYAFAVGGGGAPGAGSGSGFAGGGGGSGLIVIKEFYAGGMMGPVGPQGPGGPLPKFLSGLEMGNDTTLPLSVLDFVTGVACSDDDTTMMVLAAAGFKKNCNAPWAVGSGNGALDAGTVLAVNTWYDVFEIMRTDTGVVDVLLSASATPTLPTNYTKKRRLGSVVTDASAHILPFTQVHDDFLLAAAIVSLNNQGANTSPVNAALAVPIRVKVIAYGTIYVNAVGTLTFDSPDQTLGGPGHVSIVGSTTGSAGEFRIRTNTSGQIQYQATTTMAGGVYLNTRGWVDSRGK